jgi:transcription elongation factor SPT5
MNPALVAPTGGMVGSGNMGRGPRDRHIGLTVTVIKGPHKGYVGTIKDTNGLIARVELRTGNKVIMIDKEKLYRREWVIYLLLIFSFANLLFQTRW